MAGIGGNKPVNSKLQGTSNVDRIHTAEYGGFQTYNRMTDDLRRQVADDRIGDVGHKHGFEMTVLKGRNQFFALQMTKSGDDFGQKDAGKTEFSGLVTPCQN